jgi:hypothetical protein
MTSDLPVWLLDVDGVLNAASEKPDRSVWPLDQWTHTHATAGGHRWPILVARPVVDFIRKVHTDGQAEIRWHTTWQHDAQCLSEVLDLPTFAVAEAPEFKTAYLDRAAGWWKLPAAERVLTEEGRALVWTDDDATDSLGREGADDLRALGSLLLIAPAVTTGLTPKHLRRITDFLTA